MEQEHHNKVMITIGILILAVIIILGLAAVFGLGKNKESETPPVVVDTRTDYEKMIDGATATSHYSPTGPEVISLVEKMSVPKSSPPRSQERAALIKSMSSDEI